MCVFFYIHVLFFYVALCQIALESFCLEKVIKKVMFFEKLVKKKNKTKQKKQQPQKKQKNETQPSTSSKK